MRSNLQFVTHKVFSMKKIKFFILFITLSLFGCTSAFPKVASYYISSFTFTDDEKLWNAETALSSDGKSIVIAGLTNFDLINLKTGNRENLDERFNVNNKILHGPNDDVFADSLVYWSSDGRYIGVLADHYEPTSISAVGEVTYIFDLQDNSFRRFNTQIRSFSPFSSDKIWTYDGVYNLKDASVIPLLADYDFRQEKEFGAIGDFLWSKASGIPVAMIQTQPTGASSESDIEIVLWSLDTKDPNNPKYSVSTGFISKFPNQLAGIFFDPTGEYILVAEWQCHESTTPCSITPFHADNVYDTVLTLVRWRTQERQELIRLTEIDPEHVVAYGDMDWSADGSTIFISRKDAQPIVIKLK